MSASSVPARSQGPPAKRITSVGSVRSASPATAELEKPSRLQAPKSQPKNGNTVFDTQAFLARPGLGRRILNLKKNEAALPIELGVESLILCGVRCFDDPQASPAPRHPIPRGMVRTLSLSSLWTRCRLNGDVCRHRDR